MKIPGHQNFYDETQSSQPQTGNSFPVQRIGISMARKNNKMNLTDSNEYTISNQMSQMLSSISEISSYNSYGDFDEKIANRSVLLETGTGSRSPKSVDESRHNKKHLSSVLEAIFRNCRGRTKMTQKICKLCLYDSIQTDFGPLLTPCKCRGSLKYVHEECLKTYLILRKHNFFDRTLCESCKAPLQMKIEYKQCFHPEKILSEGLIPFINAFLLFLAFCLLIVILIIYLFCFEVDSSILTLNNDFKDRKLLYILCLSMFWIVAFFSIVISIFSYIKTACFVQTISSWKISNFHNPLQPKADVIDDEQVPQSWVKNWCPIHFFSKQGAEEITNKVQIKYDFTIKFKQEQMFTYTRTLEENNNTTLKNQSKNTSFAEDLEKSNLDFNAEFIEKGPDQYFEPTDTKKPVTAKFNFTFRIEDFPSKSHPLPFSEESKPKPLPLQPDPIEHIKSLPKNLLNNGKAILQGTDPKVDPLPYDTPAIRRDISKNRMNSFQHTLKRISKEKLLEDIKTFINYLDSAFLNYDFNKYFRIRIILKMHSYSLEYIRKMNQVEETKIMGPAKPNNRIARHEMNNDRKKMLCLKKKSQN